MKKPTWLFEDRLASFNGDTFRAELSPRRVAPGPDGKIGVVTPEKAAEIEQEFLRSCAQAADEGNPKPNKKDFVFVDVQARHAPKVWKCYELIDDINHPDGKRFFRVGEYDTFDEVVANVPSA